MIGWYKEVRNRMSYYVVNLPLSSEVMEIISKTWNDQEASWAFIILCFMRIHE